MLNQEDIKNDLEALKEARKGGLPIADWRDTALKLFCKLCNNGEGGSCNLSKTLSKELAIECMAELDSYFNIFGFVDDGEKRKWQKLSSQLRVIYSS